MVDTGKTIYVRVEFLHTRGIGAHENIYMESCVLNIREHLVESQFSEAKRVILTEGFVVPNRFNGAEQITDYDQGRWIAPGAVMAVAPCDERGYTPHDRRVAAERERDRRSK